MSGISPEGTNYLNSTKGLKSWLCTLDHKRIGIMYLFTILGFFLVGGIYAILVRLEHWTPGTTIMSADTYNKAFTYHGTIMVFMVIIPMIPAAIGNFILPMMLGAKDVAFPRLNLLSYYIFISGAAVALSTLFFRGVDTGWTFYTPYSTRTGSSAALMVSAAFIMGFSSILTALNFIATTHKLRAEGLTWGRLPLFIWSVYATSIIQILATPVLALTLALLFLERVFNIGIFDPALGGDPVLFQHFFWFYSHPAVYIMILPAMGVINEVIPVFSRKPIFGYKAMAAAIFGIACVAFLVWGHHLFTSGESNTSMFLFSLITMFVAVPTGVKVFGWLATLYKGSISFEAPMLYAFAFLFVFTIGGLTGVVLATIATDMHFQDTYYVVAHFHYVMVGGTLMGFMAGAHYWFPKFFGKMYNELAAKISWLLIFLGFNVTFFPQFIMGQLGMPRRYYNYLPEFQNLHRWSTVGAIMISVGFVIAAVYFAQALLGGKKAPANPWRALTLEWQTSSPPPTENFKVDPVVTGSFYDFRSDNIKAA
jgi:cytochrome c oxidase subunit 1